MDNRSPLRRILFNLTIPFWIIVLFILMFLELAARWLDQTVHTGLTRPKISVEEVECLIETYIQLGSTSDEAVAFLELFDLPHSELLPSERFVSRSFTPKDDELLEYRNRSKTCLSAGVKNVGKSLLFTDDLRLLFFFDDQNKLVAYTVEMFSTGL